MNLLVKVCGMKYAANIAEIAALHPDYLGFIFYENSPRAISPVTSELIAYIPPPIRTVGVFVNENVNTVLERVKQFSLKAVQLHGYESVADCNLLKESGVEVIKAFGIDEQFDFNRLKAYENTVDAFLFDTQTAAHGGSGKSFDWTLIGKYELQIRYFLSGGIDLHHVSSIHGITDERLKAVDINSKFEIEPGKKDVEKVKEFIKNIKRELPDGK